MKVRSAGMREMDSVIRATFYKDMRVFDALRAVLEELRFSSREYEGLLTDDPSRFNDHSEWFHKDGLDIMIFVSSTKIWVVACGPRFADFRNALNQYVE